MDKASCRNIRICYELIVIFRDCQDHNDHPVLREALSVTHDNASDIIGRSSVHQKPACSDLLLTGHTLLSELYYAAVFSYADVL